MNSEYLVEVQDLKQYFPVKTGFMKNTYLKAVDGVSFAIRPGETLGLVGESGCGKTTVGRTLLRLYEPTGGKVLFNGEEVTNKNITALRKEMQMVFQDPYSSLDPRMTVEDIIGEPLDGVSRPCGASIAGCGAGTVRDGADFSASEDREADAFSGQAAEVCFSDLLRHA